MTCLFKNMTKSMRKNLLRNLKLFSNSFNNRKSIFFYYSQLSNFEKWNQHLFANRVYKNLARSIYHNARFVLFNQKIEQSIDRRYNEKSTNVFNETFSSYKIFRHRKFITKFFFRFFEKFQSMNTFSFKKNLSSNFWWKKFDIEFWMNELLKISSQYFLRIFSFF